MELQRRLTRRKKKSAFNSIWGRRREPLEPGHIANAKHRNEIFRVIIVSDPFVRRSKCSVIISVESIDLTIIFFSFSFVGFFLVRKLAYANYLLSY